MIAVDTNILVYAHRTDSTWHDRAEACTRGLAEATAPWVIPQPCLHEFCAIVTRAGIYSPPSTLAAALTQIDHWLESPSLTICGESPRHWATLRRLLTQAKATGAVVHDARISAICLDHGVSALWTADRDFSRFRGLRAVNPLVTS